MDVVNLTPGVVRRSDAFGRIVIESYAQGRKEGSRRRALYGVEKNHQLQAEARKAECAFAVWLGLDPFLALDWTPFTDAGTDVQFGRARFDVKSTGPRGRFLLWPVCKRDIYAIKPFHALVFVRGAGAEWEIAGWVSKRAFAENKQIADSTSRLTPGTWFMDKQQLWPMADLSARLARMPS